MATSKQAELVSKNYMIVFVLITLLVVGITALIGKALVTSIVRDNKVVKAKSLADKQLKANLVAAPQLVDAYSAMGKEAGVLGDALPNTADFPSLIVALEAMSNDAGVTLKSVSPSQIGAVTTVPTTASSATGSGTSADTTPASNATTAPLPQPYQFSVAIDGTYSAQQKFLSDIEISARPMRVMGIQFTGTGSSLDGELQLETFYQAKAQWPFGTETIK